MEKDVSHYAIRVRGDNLDMLHCSTLTRIDKYFVVLNLTLSWPANLGDYDVFVDVTDTTYAGDTVAAALSPRATCHVTFTYQGASVRSHGNGHQQLILNRNASRYTQIITLKMTPTPVTYMLDDANGRVNAMFSVTPRSGIVYLNDPSILVAWPSHVLVIAVRVGSVGGASRTEDVHIDIHTPDATPTPPCGPVQSSCAAHSDPLSCEAACGLGAPSGRCVMRLATPTANKHMVGGYGTCSPSISTCPDTICDDVELVDPAICPQDCTENEPTGQALLHDGGRGLKMGKGTCSCNDRPGKGYVCLCESRVVPPWRHTYTTTTTTTTTSDHDLHSSNLTNHLTNTTTYAAVPATCATTCRALSICCSLLLVAAATTLALYMRHRLRHKHTHSSAHAVVMRSEYVLEDNISPSPYTVNWSPKVTHLHNLCQIDEKWEFARRNLLLGKTLGEGEFGLVVRGNAYGMNGHDGLMEVAVKMVKNCGTRSELADLISELNLLKEVDHPNVVKLLGACTADGPLYVIVEYCEKGSLRNYMRGYHRHFYATHNDEPCHVKSTHQPHDTEQPASPRPHPPDPTPEYVNTDAVSSSVLLSFCWQIACGMQYLADMKVVHRDLAARNVLVTDRNQAKISDFGMSRDVHEADSYLRKSKGRLPVKWMAPESLYDQMYTTKSDVWSYGILVWEIATLGASPYPGIAPERLFELLKSGYRMSRPDHCSDELYAVMQKCWKTDPNQRPPFTELAHIFDRILQVDMDYLDLEVIQERVPVMDEYDRTVDGLSPGSPPKNAAGFTNDTYTGDTSVAHVAHTINSTGDTDVTHTINTTGDTDVTTTGDTDTTPQTTAAFGDTQSHAHLTRDNQPIATVVSLAQSNSSRRSRKSTIYRTQYPKTVTQPSTDTPGLNTAIPLRHGRCGLPLRHGGRDLITPLRHGGRGLITPHRHSLGGFEHAIRLDPLPKPVPTSRQSLRDISSNKYRSLGQREVERSVCHSYSSMV